MNIIYIYIYILAGKRNDATEMEEGLGCENEEEYYKHAWPRGKTANCDVLQRVM